MKRTNRTVGLLGAVMIAFGLILAWSAVAIAKSNSGLALGLVLGSSFVYILGGMMAVSHFDFKRGTTVYLLISLGRLAYAGAAVLTLVRATGP